MNYTKRSICIINSLSVDIGIENKSKKKRQMRPCMFEEKTGVKTSVGW